VRDVALQAQPVTVSRGEWLTLDEAELAAVAVRNHDLPRKLVSRSEFQNAAVFVSALTTRERRLVSIAGTHRKIFIAVHIRVVAQFAPQSGLQSSLNIEGEVPPPIPRAFALKGIYELKPDQWSFLDVDTQFGPDLVACALGNRGNCPLPYR
jgi:hypothetical protein